MPAELPTARPGGVPRSQGRGRAWARVATLGGAAFLASLMVQDRRVHCEAAVPGAAATAAPSLFSKCLAEAIGTAIIVQGGCGVVAASKYCGASIGGGASAFVWGISVALAAYATRDVSGAHLNPAVTAALAVNKPESFPKEEVLPYVLAQTLGATVAGAVNYIICGKAIAALEKAEGLVRGAAGSCASFAGAFGMVPNASVLTPLGALLAEVWMTGILAFLIFAATDPNGTVPDAAAPAFIGATVAILITSFGAITGCGMNPARDLGPRLVTAVAGWGGVAWTSWWVYTLGPIIGAVLGGALYQATLGQAKVK